MSKDPREIVQGLIREAKQAGNKRLQQVLESAAGRIDNLIQSATQQAQEEADKLLKEARQEAEEIITEARARAEEIMPGERVEKKEADLVEVQSSKIQAQSGQYVLIHAPTDTLVIQCSDHRFQQVFSSFCNGQILPGENFDLLAFPGASQLLVFGEANPKLTNSLLRPIKFLIKQHGVKRIVIIMHEDCGWYNNFVSTFFRVTEPMRETQEKDMRQAKKALRDLFPGIAVDLYYATIAKGDSVEFHPVL